jgi:hypothetical protein
LDRLQLPARWVVAFVNRRRAGTVYSNKHPRWLRAISSAVLDFVPQRWRPQAHFIAPGQYRSIVSRCDDFFKPGAGTLSFRLAGDTESRC